MDRLQYRVARQFSFSKFVSVGFMARQDFVTVTIVTYNSGRFIKRCLESILAQRYPNKEIVVIDNASTDGTIDILEQFEDRCRVYYNEENIGFASAQNQAIGLSAAIGYSP